MVDQCSYATITTLNVIRRVCQDPISINMAVEEQVVQTEACIYCQIATTTSVEEQDMHTEF